MRNWRIILVAGFLLIFAAGISARLSYLQIFSHGYYKALSRGQQALPDLAPGQRGAIYLTDKTGEPHAVAMTQKASFVFATPKEVTDKETSARDLSLILGISESTLKEQLKKEETLFEVLKRKIGPEEKEAIEILNLPGIHIQEETVRFYPQNELASRALGFVNQDGEGQYGIESFYQTILAGKEGLQKTIRNIAGILLGGIPKTSQNGQDIQLTLDFNIQSMAENLLKKASENLGTREGTIIVMDPSTGNILALANYPGYNPNEYSKVKDLGIFQNPAIESVFEPGSVFKALTMAASIDAGAITPATTYKDAGIVRVGGYKILNYDERIWGERSMTEVLEYSINTGAVFAEQQLGHQRFLEYAENFGVFGPTGIDLAGEVYSQNKELKKGYEINFTTASFGQGIEMTPMQLMRAYTALANGGRMASPRVTGSAPKISGQIISPKTASEVTSMLVSVIENGFSKKARIPGYYIAGKTGTAQITYAALGENKAGYSNETIQSFIGYAPAFSPKFLALVKLNNPQTKTAEYSAMPVFRELTKYILDYYEIPPDYEE